MITQTKSARIPFVLILAPAVLGLLALTSCTTGSAARTSSTLYQPTNSAQVEILFEKPARPYTVIGTVGSKASTLASDDAILRAMQKEAAELGAHAILVQGEGITQVSDWNGSYQKGRALALRWNEGAPSATYSVTPTSTTPTTPAAEQIIPPNTGQR
ncbi:MAG: hypothetical protein SFU85_01990 [Candidatus Methylacidiphilales bacterium]|nr:hypothetical protein [Candidatus Methylacidiphilales bacterium]